MLFQPITVDNHVFVFRCCRLSDVQWTGADCQCKSQCTSVADRQTERHSCDRVLCACTVPWYCQTVVNHWSESQSSFGVLISVAVRRQSVSVDVAICDTSHVSVCKWSGFVQRSDVSQWLVGVVSGTSAWPAVNWWSSVSRMSSSLTDAVSVYVKVCRFNTSVTVTPIKRRKQQKITYCIAHKICCRYDYVSVWITLNQVVMVVRQLTLWRPLLSYGYSYKASCARPG